MRRNLTLFGAIVMILAAAPASVSADLVDVVNTIRSQGCGKSTAVERPLRATARLDEAARRLARGNELETATSAAGYRAKKSASIHFQNTKGSDDIAQMLAKRYCGIVADSELRDIGVYRRGEEVWLVLASSFSLEDADDASAVNRRVLELINVARSRPRKCGRIKFLAATPLHPDAALESAALAHAEDMAARSYMGHRGSDGSMPADRATQAGYTWRVVAENVAAGQTTAAEVVDTWLASPGHCANLMGPHYLDTGVAHAVNPGSEKGTYWVQILAAQERNDSALLRVE